MPKLKTALAALALSAVVAGVVGADCRNARPALLGARHPPSNTPAPHGEPDYRRLRADERAARVALLDTRPDLDGRVREYLMAAPTDKVEEAVRSWPKLGGGSSEPPPGKKVGAALTRWLVFPAGNTACLKGIVRKADALAGMPVASVASDGTVGDPSTWTVHVGHPKKHPYDGRWAFPLDSVSTPILAQIKNDCTAGLDAGTLSPERTTCCSYALTTYTVVTSLDATWSAAVTPDGGPIDDPGSDPWPTDDLLDGGAL